MKISAEKFWEILFTDEAWAFKDWRTIHNSADAIITPKRFDEALVVLNATLEDLGHEVRKAAIRNLASAIKKICPEAIPLIIEAATPYKTFLQFLQGVEPYTDFRGTEAVRGVDPIIRFLEISLMMEKHIRGRDLVRAMQSFSSVLFHEWCDLAKQIESSSRKRHLFERLGDGSREDPFRFVPIKDQL